MKNAFYYFSPTLFFVLFFRAALDPILDLTKIGGMGLGALLNLFLVVMLLFILLKSKFTLPGSLVGLWGGFILMGFISIIMSPDKVGSLRSFFAVLTYFSCFAIPYFFLKKEEDVVVLFKFVIYSSVIPFCFAFKEFLLPAGSTGDNGFRLFGSFSHPNIFAFYLVLIASMCFFVLKSKLLTFNAKFIFYVKIILIASLVCLLATKTRSAWIALIFVFAVYGVMVERRYIVYLVILGFVAMLIPSIQERVFDMLSGGSVDTLDEGEALNSYAWRQVVWGAAWSYIVDKPFFGHGYDTFSYYFLDFFPLEEDSSFDAHNTFVQIAFDMGFLGVFAYIILFIGIFGRLCKLIKVDKAGATILIGLLLSYVVVGYSDNMLFYLSYNWYFWLVMGGMFYIPSKVLNEHFNKKKVVISEKLLESRLS